MKFRLLTITLFAIFSLQALEDECGSIQPYIQATINFCESFDKSQRLFSFMEQIIAGNIQTMNLLVENPEIDFFETDMIMRPGLYKSVQLGEVLINAYTKNDSDKNNIIKEDRTLVRNALNQFLVYLYKSENRVEEASRAKELLQEFLNNYFVS